ncbi:MAG: hypothetical protein PGN34_18365 [Methylobacterium frigidaeris]
MSDEAIMGRAEGEPIHPRFPVQVTLFGIAAVIIPEAEYWALTDRNAALSSPYRSRLNKSPEVRKFILERIETDDMDRIREAAVERFGEDRVPSRSALSRFMVKRRAANRLATPRKTSHRRD